MKIKKVKNLDGVMWSDYKNTFLVNDGDDSGVLVDSDGVATNTGFKLTRELIEVFNKRKPDVIDKIYQDEIDKLKKKTEKLKSNEVLITSEHSNKLHPCDIERMMGTVKVEDMIMLRKHGLL